MRKIFHAGGVCLYLFCRRGDSPQRKKDISTPPSQSFNIMGLIKNRQKLINEGENAGEKKQREHLLTILEFALKESDPFFLVWQTLKKIDFTKYQSVFVIGAGKGTYRMALAAEKFFGSKIASGWINAPQKIGNNGLKKIKVTLAGHPFPNQGSVKGTRRIISLLKKAKKGDLVLALFSGGASALFCLPVEGITLADKTKITRLLLRSGAGIKEMNIVRKHLSQVKGGRLGEMAEGAEIIALYLSDVVGDDLSVVASGPTVPDASTFANAVKVLKKYKIWQKSPMRVKKYLEMGRQGLKSETPKRRLFGVKNIIVGSHRVLARAASQKARELGYSSKILTSEMEGESMRIGLKFLRFATHWFQKKQIFIATGETTFKVKTKNPGGRNQQMALAILPDIKPGQTFLAFDSDGVDGVGPEKVGGVIIDEQTRLWAEKRRLDIKKALRTNNSYRFFKQAGGHIKTGYVGTNLGDIVLIIG